MLWSTTLCYNAAMTDSSGASLLDVSPLAEEAAANNDSKDHWDARRLVFERNASDSWYEQADIEARVKAIRDMHGFEHSDKLGAVPKIPRLDREKHATWLLRNLRRVTHGYSAYDALQPWVAYWIVHSLNVLNVPIPDDDAKHLVDLLRSMRVNDLGVDDGQVDSFAGGPGQCVGHIASTFAGVMALISIGTEDALETIMEMKDGLLAFVRRRYDSEEGSFEVSKYGERDVRALYCALAVASVVSFVGDTEEVGKDESHSTETWWYKSVDIQRYIRSLLAFDGGLAGECGAEAHGGNTYCGFAASVLVGLEWTDQEKEELLDWVIMRQMTYEGGFQGRVNKLVDSCYSFWIGGTFAMMGEKYDTSNTDSLEMYVLQCCQQANGGLRDKPGAPRDLMHTCYALSGLSVAQHYASNGESNAREHKLANSIEKVNVVYNLREDRLAMAKIYFERCYREGGRKKE